jgi:hypothetical protein
MSIQTTAGGMPVIILKEGTRERKGKEAQKNNITAAKKPGLPLAGPPEQR